MGGRIDVGSVVVRNAHANRATPRTRDRLHALASFAPRIVDRTVHLADAAGRGCKRL